VTITSPCSAKHLPGVLACILGIWGGQPSQWTLAAQSPQATDPCAVTQEEIEQRARYLALKADIGEQAKVNFSLLTKSKSTEDKLRSLQLDVIRTNPGKTRDELIAIFHEHQKEFGAALQKQAIDSARAALLPTLRNDALQELIDECKKVQMAKDLGIEVTDNEVRALIKTMAARNKMTYEEFALHLKGMGIDIATVAERIRGTTLGDLIRRMRPGSSPP
jgi:SurA-like protein